MTFTNIELDPTVVDRRGKCHRDVQQPEDHSTLSHVPFLKKWKVEGNLASMILHHRPTICETHRLQETIAPGVRRLPDAQGCRVPLHPFDAGSELKAVQIRLALSDWLRHGRIKIRDWVIGRRSVAQGKAFSTGEDDDILDCLAIAIRLLDELLA